MDTAEYKKVVLGMLLLNYISDAFKAKHAILNVKRKQGDYQENTGVYRSENIFWVTNDDRWGLHKTRTTRAKTGADMGIT